MSKYPSCSISLTRFDSSSVLLHLIQWHPHSIKSINYLADNVCIVVSYYKNRDKKREIPLEIDDHFKLYGKEPWEVDYGENCSICNVRVDEYGFCSCGSSGD